MAVYLFISPLFLSAAPTAKGEDIKISLMIIGPGHPLYVWWGHIGLVIENTRKKTSYFYDFGNFSFEEENFYRNFAMGRLYYLKIRSKTEPYLRYLKFFDRWVHTYELNLTNDEKERVYQILEEGIKRENRTYLYHHYEDNCSTRVRDVLDEAMGGEIRENTPEYALSFRDQANRFIRPFWPYMLLNFLQGSTIDRPISYWDALFLPNELELFVQNHTRPNGEAFVKEFKENQDGIRPFIPEEPFPRMGAAFLWGMILFFITLILRTEKRPALWALWRFLTVIAVAVPGLFLCFMMFFTDHHVTLANLNALIACPVLLGALRPSFAYGKSLEAAGRYERFWDIQLGLIILALLGQNLPGINQDNGAIVALFLPLALAQGTVGAQLVRYLKTPPVRTYPWARKLL